jgi:hypothetical protein
VKSRRIVNPILGRDLGIVKAVSLQPKIPCSETQATPVSGSNFTSEAPPAADRASRGRIAEASSNSMVVVDQISTKSNKKRHLLKRMGEAQVERPKVHSPLTSIQSRL